MRADKTLAFTPKVGFEGWRMVRKISALFGINTLLLVSLLARNVLVARLIGVENFGVAMTFALIVAALELTTALGADRFIVQDAEGDSPRVAGVIHLLNILRALGAAVVIYLLAGPIARLFGVPDLVWAYQLLALVPLLRSLINFDVYRQHRDMVFWRSSAIELIGVGAGILVIFPCLLLYDDHRLMLISLLVQYAVQTVASHLLSARRFGLALDRAVARRWLEFSWPIMTNNVLMFGLMHGDRLVIGSFYGVRTLGWFTAAQSITMAPTLILHRTMGNVALAALSRRRDDEAAFAALAVLNQKFYLASAFVVGAGLYLLGGWAMILLYGPQFAEGLQVFSILVAITCLRMARGGSLVPSMARGQSANDLISNLPRVIGLIPVALAAWSGWSVAHALLIVLATEFIGLALSISLLRRSMPGRLPALAALWSAGSAFIALLAVDSLIPPASAPVWLPYAEAAAFGFLTLAVVWLCRDALRLDRFA